MAAITLEDVNKSLKDQNKTLGSVDKGIDKVSSNLSAFLNVMQGKKLKGLEGDIEGGTGGGAKSGDGVSAAQAGLFGGIGAALAGLAGMITPLIAGLAGALLASFDETFNDISRAIFATMSKTTEGIRTRIGALFGNIFGEEGLIGKQIKSIRTAILGLMYLDADGKPLPGKLQFDKLGKMTGFSQAGPVAKLFRLIRKVYNVFEEFIASPVMKGLGKVLSGFGTVLKRIFLPIGLIFTAYDTIKGAIEGYEEEGFVGALTGAISGLLSSVVGAPLNLIKSMSSWLLEKMGFEDASKWLDENVDFEQMIKDFGMSMAKFIKKILGSIGEFFANPGEALANAGSAVWEGLKNMISGDPNADKPVDPNAAESLEIPGASRGSLGTYGKLFPNFGKGTPVMLHDEEAIIPKNSGLGSMLGQIMDRSSKAGFGKFAMETGSSLKAKEDAMRASGASDMEIASAIMGDMPGIMSSLKGIGKKMDFGSMTMPKGPTNNNLGNVFTGMVNESKQAQQTMAQPAPVIIQDNSSRSSGVSNTAMPVQSTPYDFNDPFVRGLRA